MKRLLHIANFAFLLLCSVANLAPDARADVKIKAKNSSGGQTSEQVVYIKGKRQRTEQNDASVSILQCDLRRTLQLAVPTKTYVAMPFDQNTGAAGTTAKESMQMSPPAAPVQRGGIVTSTFTATDTGERKKMFGYVARRIKTSIVTESSPDACQVSRSRMETDGWYIDAQFGLDCTYAARAAYTSPAQAGGCRDQYRTKQLGVAKLGYPVMVTTTLFDEKGAASYTFTQEVIEITNAVLDSALFDAPADYRHVNDMSELYGASAAAMSAANNSSDDDDAASDNSGSSYGSGASQSGSAMGAKREGVVRVGVTTTMTGLTGDNVNAAALAEAMRRALLAKVTGSNVEVVTLSSQQPQLAEAEAKQKNCDFILYSTVAHKKGGGGGGFGGFLKKSAAIASGAAVAGNTSADGSVAGSLKAKDELTLEYKLRRGGEPVVANTLKAKAKSDGEDLISQLAGQAAATVLAAATVK